MAAQLRVSESAALARGMAVAYAVGLAVAAVCMLVAWWKIYHPASRWGPWVVAIWSVLLAWACLGQMGRPVEEPTPWRSHG